MNTARCLILILFLLLPHLVTARAQEIPMLWGGLDWSSDGRYIAATTDRGVHIHNSEDLSLYKVLTDYNWPAIKWSNAGLRLATATYDPGGVTIWDSESDAEIHLMIPGDENRGVFSIEWGPGDTVIAASGFSGVYFWNIESASLMSFATFDGIYEIGYPQIHWRPDGVDIMSGSIANGIAVWNYYTGILVDFIWNASGNSPARWSPDGKMIAAGDGPATVWKVLPDDPTDAWAEIGGERIHKLVYEPGRLQGLSWHPDSTKLAFVFLHAESGYPPERDFSRDGALIWDISTGATKLIPGVFLIDVHHTDKAIEWSPDGSKLAAMSSDGRIVIWETDTYQVIAEYDGYRSLLDW